MSSFRELTQDVLPEHLEDLRHRDHCGYASSADLPHNFMGAISAHKNRDPRDERQNEERDHLTEHVAEWDQTEKTQREYWSEPFRISGDDLLR